MNKQFGIRRFTPRFIENLEAQEPDASSPNYEVTDAVESGLKIAVYKSGKRSFRHRYNYLGVKKMITLGPYPGVTVERARERVRENKALLAEDIDPREERQAKRDAIDFEAFATEHFRPHAEETMRSYKDVKSRINKHLIPNFGDKKLAQISKQEVSKFHKSLRKQPPTANRSLSLLSAMYNYAILLINGWGVDWDPFRAFKYFKGAAKAGMIQAQYVVGILYTDNLIVKRDFNYAYYWVKKSAEEGYEPAEDHTHHF